MPIPCLSSRYIYIVLFRVTGRDKAYCETDSRIDYLRITSDLRPRVNGLKINQLIELEA